MFLFLSIRFVAAIGMSGMLVHIEWNIAVQVGEFLR
ncbi:hypothetical protein Pjdr2_1516 [Paenibacillus sp. JDR-2]|nr:hypothetical protein Pjdr2_1516 [Paenibacillus sp. JDR-2]